MFEQVDINNPKRNLADEINLKINKKLELLFDQKQKFTTLMNEQSDINYYQTYESQKQKLEDRLNCSYNLSQLITLIVFVKTDLHYINEIEISQHNLLFLKNRIDKIIDILNEDIKAYKSVAYSLGIEINTVKELIHIKFPNERYNIN